MDQPLVTVRRVVITGLRDYNLGLGGLKFHIRGNHFFKLFRSLHYTFFSVISSIQTLSFVTGENILFWLILQDIRHWPLIPPLPSYGRGRERPGARYMSLIHGNGLTDVIITG